jgi:hypothetical protein
MIETPAKVAQILSASEIAVNVGQDHDVSQGDDVVVWRKVDIRDPETAEVLGSINRQKLRLKISFVEERFSIARIQVSSPNFFPSFFGTQTQFITGTHVPDDEHIPLKIGDEVTVYATGDQERNGDEGDTPVSSKPRELDEES